MRIPGYRLHKASGQAVCTIKGRDHYLGRHKSVESRDRYRALVVEHLATGVAPERDSDEGVTIGEVMIPYLTWADQHYRLPSGKPTSQVLLIRLSLKVLRRLYQDIPVRDFGPNKL